MRHTWEALGLLAVVLICSQAAGAGQVAGTSCADCDAPQLIRQLGLREAPEPVRDRDGWVRPRRVLVRGGPEMIEWMRPAAPGVELVAAPDLATALREVPTAEAVLGFCSADVLEAGTRLQWVQLWSAGAEYCVRIPALAERNILLTNAQRVASP